jgi:class 3 adenylate cyclase
MPTSVDPKQPQPLLVTSLEHSIWLGLRADLEASLKRFNLMHLSSPSMLILHDMIDNAVRAMHHTVFMRMAADDFGMGLQASEESLEGLFAAEVAEHGSQNIVQHCIQNGWHVSVNFPRDADTIVAVQVPVPWEVSSCDSSKLVDALGYQWHKSAVEGSSGGNLFTLKKHSSKTPVYPGGLLDAAGSESSMQHIYEKLGYGIIQFSSAGEVIAVSPSMLSSVKLPVNDTSLTALCAAIPFGFYNDIVWGMALAGASGVFENYRTRMRIPGEENVSVLFNVSGYRDEHAIIHSLWQVVSLAGGGSSLGEGSILSEARIHNITRNYVPQLVEAKAREAVRLGKDKLSNEECFVAVLFCDIVGFTSYVESNASSESVINTLNTILRRVSSSVKRFNGSIDKFMGDSVMAIFRDPADAVKAALDMQSHSADINGLRSRAGQTTLRLRIGIHWGEVVIGNVGTAERLDWTAIGDVVNTASRIEKNCKPGSILVSQATRDAIATAKHPEIMYSELFEIHVKGKREALSVCHIRHPDDNLLT